MKVGSTPKLKSGEAASQSGTHAGRGASVLIVGDGGNFR
jgi:hypothetical protein